MQARNSTGSTGAQLTLANLGQMLSLLYLLAVFVFVVEVSWHALSMHYDTPNRDDWRILDDLFSTSSLQWVLTDQNGHWIPGTLALILLDYSVFGGHMHLLAAASVLCAGVALGALVVAFAPRRLLRDPLGLTALASAAFALSWGMSRHDLVWGTNQGTLMAAMWALISLAAVGTWAERRHAETPAGANLLMFSALAATAATFSQGIGFSAWGGLLVVAVAARVRLRTLAALIGGALGTLLLYRSGLHTQGRGSMQIYGNLAASEPMRLVGQALAFVGSPVQDVLSALGLVTGDDRHEVALLCGAAGSVAFAATALRTALTSPTLSRRQVLAVGLPATALTGGLMVALNRALLPESVVAIRFATWSALFWVGLSAALPSRRPTRRMTWVGIVAVLSMCFASLLSLPALEAARTVQQNRRDQLSVLRTLHLLDIRWDATTGGTKLAASPDRSYRVVDRLRRDARSFFAEPAASLPGSSLAIVAALRDDQRCSGAVTHTNRIAARNGHALSVSGWSVDRHRDRPIEQIVIIDEDDVITGLGVSVNRSTRIARASLPARDFPWTGYIRAPLSAGPYRAFALLDDGRTACPLGPVMHTPGDARRLLRTRALRD